MGRFKQAKAIKGSQLFIQKLVNNNCVILNKAISRILNANFIEWRSPIEKDEFAEYRDNDALNTLDIKLNNRPLESFWPEQGPQWDALGLTDNNEPVFVEAKAHIDELFSSPLKASSEKSISLIKSSLNESANFLSASQGTDWSFRFYQYSNRIAHMYFLRELNNIPAHMLFVYFLGNTGFGSTITINEWKAAINVMLESLGIRGKFPSYIHDVFIKIGAFDTMSIEN